MEAKIASSGGKASVRIRGDGKGGSFSRESMIGFCGLSGRAGTEKREPRSGRSSALWTFMKNEYSLKSFSPEKRERKSMIVVFRRESRNAIIARALFGSKYRKRLPHVYESSSNWQ